MYSENVGGNWGLPAGYMETLTAPGRSYAAGISSMGNSIGDAIKQYHKNEEERSNAKSNFEMTLAPYAQDIESTGAVLGDKMFSKLQSGKATTGDYLAASNAIKTYEGREDKRQTLALQKEQRDFMNKMMSSQEARAQAAADEQKAERDRQSQFNKAATGALGVGQNLSDTPARSVEFNENVQMPPNAAWDTTMGQYAATGKFPMSEAEMVRLNDYFLKKANPAPTLPPSSMVPPAPPKPTPPPNISSFVPQGRTEINITPRAGPKELNIYSGSTPKPTPPSMVQYIPRQSGEPMRGGTPMAMVPPSATVPKPEEAEALPQFAVAQTRTENYPAVPASNTERQAAALKHLMDNAPDLAFEDQMKFINAMNAQFPTDANISIKSIGDGLKAVMVNGRPTQILQPPTLTQAEKDDLTARFVQGYGLAPTKEEAIKLREEGGSLYSAQESVNALLKIANTDGSSLNPKLRVAGATEASLLSASIRALVLGPGAVTDKERDVLNDIARNPATIFSLDESNKTALTTLVNRLSGMVDSKARAMGLKKQGGSDENGAGVIKFDSFGRRISN